MADITDYLNQISTAVYGKDVRKAIVDSIEQCYSDGRAGAIDLNARNGVTGLTTRMTSAEARVATAEIDINNLEVDVASLTASVGSPLMASTAAGMTNTNKIYVYTGSEAGYTAGDWYYYDGSAWTSGGVYNSVAVQTDTTLSISGTAADSAAVGSAVTKAQDIAMILATFPDEYFGIGPAMAISGYDSQNVSEARPRNMPFIPEPFITGKSVSSIKFNVITAGTLTIGCYKTTDLVLSNEYLSSSYIALRTIATTSTGEQILTLSPSIYIPSGYVLAIGTPNDVCTFAYGNYGTTMSYYWFENSTPRIVRQSTNKSLGLDIGCVEYSRSVFKGKKLSIFGDSISTYAGYIPTGNASYYTGSNAGISSVNDTWWKKTIDALQFDLLVNNSWSGRAVSSIRDSSSAHSTDAGYKETNVLQLKDGATLPDVIIVKLGINDFNNECPLGTYEGQTALPTDPSTFTNAYAIMLDLIMTNFPLAKVYCCTLMPCEKNGAIGFPEVNGNGNTITEFNDAIRKLAHAFGAEVLNHDVCGITYYNLSTYMGDYSSSTQNSLHPNAAGHSLIANQTIAEMDAAVRIRY